MSLGARPRSRFRLKVRIVAQQIEISLNHNPLRIPVGTRLDVLLELLCVGGGLNPELVALDSVCVSSDAWASVVLTSGARVDTIALDQ